MRSNQWQIDLATDLGSEDGWKAVEETLQEQGKQAVLDELAKILRGDLNGWDEAAASASAHSFHCESELNSDPEDADDPFVWDDDTIPAYYRAYAEASLKRAKEIAESAEA